jgi:hypothetical protein
LYSHASEWMQAEAARMVSSVVLHRTTSDA